MTVIKIKICLFNVKTVYLLFEKVLEMDMHKC